jgi:hypothetical protein
LEATVIVAAVARERGDLEVFVNISQMTVSQMTLGNMTDSPQQRQHLLAEQVLNWSGLLRSNDMDDAMPIVVYRNVWNLETLGVGHQTRNLPRREAIRE